MKNKKLKCPHCNEFFRAIDRHVYEWHIYMNHQKKLDQYEDF